MSEYMFEGILRTPKELQAIATHRAKRIRELKLHYAGRWNVIEADGLLKICRGDHDSGTCCEFERWVQETRAEAADAKYHELLYAVVCKFPNETRHETALRYIHERESAEVAPAQQEQTK